MIAQIAVNAAGADARDRHLQRLEARVEALERELARLSLICSREPAAAPGSAIAPAAPAPEEIKTQKLPVLELQPFELDTRSTLDRLGITAAFATLDGKVAEAIRERSKAHARGLLDACPAKAAAARTAPLAFSEITIDESLIDKAFARPAPQKLDVVSDLESLHPRIAERVAGTWRTGELHSYLARLIVDERGDRAGFSPGVMSELLLLSAVLEAPDEPGPWKANARPA